MASITARIKIRIGDTATWTAAKQALAAGEVGYDTEKHELKVGDGSTLWSSLPLVNDETVVFDHKYIADVTESTENGKIKVTKDGKDTEIAVYGLKSAAYTDTDVYATADQGAKADSAVQSVTIAGKALTGSAGAVSITKEALLTALGVTPDEYLKEDALTDYVKASEITPGAENGSISVKGEDVAVKGLGSAAYKDEDAFDAVGTAAAEAGKVDAKVTTLTAKVQTNETNINSLRTDVDGIKDQIGGLTGAMHFVGTSTTDPSLPAGPTIADHEGGYAPGDVCLFGKKEYIYDGTKWSEFGDEGSFLTKSEASEIYAPKANPTFTGTVTIPVTPQNDTDAASKKYVDDAVTEADVSGKIAAEIGKLNNTDAEVEGQYVSEVKESKGVVTVKRKPLPVIPTFEGTSPIKVTTEGNKVTIAYEGSAATSSEDETAVKFVSEITTDATGKVSYKTNTFELALAALGTIEIDGGNASELA